MKNYVKKLNVLLLGLVSVFILMGIISQNNVQCMAFNTNVIGSKDYSISSTTSTFIYLNDQPVINYFTDSTQSHTYYFTAPYTQQIALYSEVNRLTYYDLKVDLYQSNDIVLVIADNTTNSIIIPPSDPYIWVANDDNSGFNNEFYLRTTIYAGYEYKVVVTQKYIPTYTEYALFFTEQNFCYQDVTSYFKGDDFVNSSNQVIYKIDSSLSFYESEILDAIEIWNSLGNVVFIRAASNQTPTVTFNDFNTNDYFLEGSPWGLTDYGTHEIRLKLEYLGTANYGQKMNTYLHEIGHALGINMDGYAATVNESFNNVMLQADKEMEILGPADREVYFALWG